MRPSRAIIVLGVVAILAAGTVFATEMLRRREADAAAAEMYARLGVGIDDAILRDSAGRSVRWDSLAGRPRALFFGFTNCPVICPTTVMDLDAARARLGGRGEQLHVDFVTIDPERDTPEVMARYFGSFERPVRAFAADEATTRRIAEAFRASYEKRPAGDGDYTMDHTASIYLVDAKGQVVDLIPFGSDHGVMDRKLAELLIAGR